MPKETKFWKMAKNKAKNNAAEITIYGDIGTSWWGDSVSAKQFAADLKALGDGIEDITVRLNSGGGSVFDGLAIRSLLKNHKASVTVHVDGWAASIASIIAMAGDTIKMAKGSMMMIHNPATSVWGGEAKDFREAADFLDKIRDSLVSVYAARTGLSEEELIELMDAETSMSAEEAVEKGFADETEEGSVVAAAMMGAVAMVNGINMDYSKFMNAPKLPSAQATVPVNQSSTTQPNTDPKNGGAEEVKDLEELKAKHPEIYNAAVKAGIDQERERIKALHDLQMPGNSAIINKAMFETGATAAEAAIEIINAQNAARKKAGENLQNDSDESGVKKVDPGAAPEDDKKGAAEEAEANGGKIAELINKRRGVAK